MPEPQQIQSALPPGPLTATGAENGRWHDVSGKDLGPVSGEPEEQEVPTPTLPSWAKPVQSVTPATMTPQVPSGLPSWAKPVEPQSTGAPQGLPSWAKPIEQPEETGVWAGIKRNTVGMVSSLYHAMTDPATPHEKAELMKKVADEKEWQRQHGYDPNEVDEKLATNPSKPTLIWHRLIDAPADQLREKANAEIKAADLWDQRDKWFRANNLRASGYVDKALAAVPMIGPFVNSIAERAERGDIKGALIDIAAVEAYGRATENLRVRAGNMIGGEFRPTGGPEGPATRFGKSPAEPATALQQGIATATRTGLESASNILSKAKDLPVDAATKLINRGEPADNFLKAINGQIDANRAVPDELSTNASKTTILTPEEVKDYFNVAMPAVADTLKLADTYIKAGKMGPGYLKQMTADGFIDILDQTYKQLDAQTESLLKSGKMPMAPELERLTQSKFAVETIKLLTEKNRSAMNEASGPGKDLSVGRVAKATGKAIVPPLTGIAFGGPLGGAAGLLFDLSFKDVHGFAESLQRSPNQLLRAAANKILDGSAKTADIQTVLKAMNPKAFGLFFGPNNPEEFDLTSEANRIGLPEGTKVRTPQEAAAAAGAKHVGTIGRGEDLLHMFNDPETGSTLALPPEKMTPENIIKEMESSRAEFRAAENKRIALTDAEKAAQTGARPVGQTPDSAFHQSFGPEYQQARGLEKWEKGENPWETISNEIAAGEKGLRARTALEREQAPNVVGRPAIQQAAREARRAALLNPKPEIKPTLEDAINEWDASSLIEKRDPKLRSVITKYLNQYLNDRKSYSPVDQNTLDNLVLRIRRELTIAGRK